MARKELGYEKRFHVFCNGTGKIPVLKTVPRIRLVKTEDSNLCVMVNFKVWK
jgi:hypothetical protein